MQTAEIFPIEKARAGQLLRTKRRQTIQRRIALGQAQNQASSGGAFSLQVLCCLRFS
jgi:hypothetical protein